LIGWWYTYPSEKYEFVSWDDSSQYMESHKIHVPNHQPDMEKYNFFKARSSSHQIWGVPPFHLSCPLQLHLRQKLLRRRFLGTQTSWIAGTPTRDLKKKKHIKTYKNNVK